MLSRVFFGQILPLLPFAYGTTGLFLSHSADNQLRFNAETRLRLARNRGWWQEKGQNRAWGLWWVQIYDCDFSTYGEIPTSEKVVAVTSFVWHVLGAQGYIYIYTYIEVRASYIPWHDTAGAAHLSSDACDHCCSFSHALKDALKLTMSGQTCPSQRTLRAKGKTNDS